MFQRSRWLICYLLRRWPVFCIHMQSNAAVRVALLSIFAVASRCILLHQFIHVTLFAATCVYQSC